MGLRDMVERVSVFLDILYHFKRTKTIFMISPSGRPIHPFLYKKPYPEKQIKGLPFSSFGIGGIFLHSSHHFIDEQKALKESEPKRPPKSMDTLS